MLTTPLPLIADATIDLELFGHPYLTIDCHCPADTPEASPCVHLLLDFFADHCPDPRGLAAWILTDHPSALSAIGWTRSTRIDLLHDAELAHLLRDVTAPTIAFSGAVGGAGTTLLAALCAAHLAPSLLADASSAPPGLDAALGLEDLPGLRHPTAASEPDLRAQLPRWGEVELLLPATPSTLDLLRGTPRILDLGTALPAADAPPDILILCTTLTVAGILAARHRLHALTEAGHPTPLLAARVIPGGRLDDLAAAQLLGRELDLLIPHDPTLPATLDAGLLDPTASPLGPALGRLLDEARTAAAWDIPTLQRRLDARVCVA